MILVTGGTGLIGSHLLFQLAKSGNTIRAIYRSEKSLKKVTKVFGYYTENPTQLLERISWVQGDITDIASMEAAFDGAHYVYHCAALISFDPRQLDDLIKTNTEGTANIVNLCVAHQVKKLCYVSSIAAIGKATKGKISTENNEWTDTNVSVYGLTKHDAELEVWRGSLEGLPVVVVNPGVVFGPGFWRSGSGSFFTYANKGKKSFLPGGTGFVSVNDVTKAMITLMESDIDRERFILVSENLSYGEVLKRIAKKLKVQEPIKQAPFWALELFWRWDGFRSKVLGKRRRLTKNMVKGFRQQETYSSEKIRTMLDFEFDNLQDILTFCCEKFKN
ncbi:NAD-dependent epimerase/dehydratase family protein [Flagellimonas flava]|uniref:Nucleoside-diphosphate-sugar epimerase n=1 Tax=Flagellimonas flava TaxID=570519 RepID=A0A1M5KD79_9FLAO|nr:NAD-dependent epimerase/dehydratase family protein [Allomuricauda flava]SHG50641.1 Nucleoside-diphosphate-sugar epimerase [Allomuricauda flava]